MALFHRRSARTTHHAGKDLRTRGTTLASATLVNRKQIHSGTRKQSWHEEAWEFYDCIPELHEAIVWMGNALSRARLFIAKAPEDGGGDPTPVDNPPDNAKQVLRELHAGAIGQGQMLRRIATNLEMTGEAFLVRLPKSIDPKASPGDDEYRWLVASVDEFSYAGGRSRLRLPEDGRSIDLDPEQVTIIRLWCPHPRVSWESDSSVRSNLPVLREVQSLSQHITATVESRLAGAGVLAIPKSTTLPNPNVSEGGNPLHHNAFVDALTQAMVVPIQDRSNASALVPIVISVDDQAIGKLQHITFATELDSKVTEMRADALRRFANGSTLPREIVLGGTDSDAQLSIGSQSGAGTQAVEDQAIKIAVEPLLWVICDALTQQLLWPALRAMGEKNPEQWVIGASTEELSQKPDRSEEAQALYDKGVLSPDSLLRENGFSTDDRPSEDEERREFARQLVLAKPELITALAPFVGFEGMEEVFQDTLQPAPEPMPGGPGDPEQDPELSGGDPNQQKPGELPSGKPSGGQRAVQPGGNRAQRAITSSATATPHHPDGWQIAAVELVALRALELAGKRMLTNSPRGIRGKASAQQVHAWDLHTVAPTPNDLDKLLDGAFDAAETVLGNQPCIQSTVTMYCRALITSGRPHRTEYLAETLRHAGCLEPSGA